MVNENPILSLYPKTFGGADDILNECKSVLAEIMVLRAEVREASAKIWVLLEDLKEVKND